MATQQSASTSENTPLDSTRPEKRATVGVDPKTGDFFRYWESRCAWRECAVAGQENATEQMRMCGYEQKVFFFLTNPGESLVGAEERSGGFSVNQRDMRVVKRYNQDCNFELFPSKICNSSRIICTILDE